MTEIVRCIRAGIEMTKEQWLSPPFDVRQRYWIDTDWGKKPPSDEMIAEVRRHHFTQSACDEPDASEGER